MSATAQTAINVTVAQTILAQLGGNQFLAMTGSHSLSAGENCLTMRLTRNKLRATHLRITLNALDLYDLVYLRVISPTARNGYKGGTVTLTTREGYYAEMLAKDFEDTTGLYTRA